VQDRQGHEAFIAPLTGLGSGREIFVTLESLEPFVTMRFVVHGLAIPRTHAAAPLPEIDDAAEFATKLATS